MVSIASVREFLESPVGREIASRAEEKRIARRAELAAEIDALTAEREKEGPRLQRELEKAEEARRRAEEVLRERQRAEGAARMAHLEAGNRFEHEVGLRRHELEETADPRIRAFVQQAWDAVEAARTRKLQFVEHPGRLNPINLRRRSVTYTNARSLRAHLAGLRSAARAAEALQYEPLAEAEVGEALEAIRATIPAIGPIEEL